MRQLPIVKFFNKDFYVDEQLKQYRNIMNPYEFYSFKRMDEILELAIGLGLEELI